MCVADDIIVVGTGETNREAVQSHDENLRALLNRCRGKGIRLNGKKLQLRKEEIQFLGHIISAKGLQADPDKISAIQEMTAPVDVPGVQRLLGMV